MRAGITSRGCDRRCSPVSRSRPTPRPSPTPAAITTASRRLRPGCGGLRRRGAGAAGAFRHRGHAVLVAIPSGFTSSGSLEEGFALLPGAGAPRWVPNVDFLHLYGPGSLEVLSLWYRVRQHARRRAHRAGATSRDHLRALHAGPPCAAWRRRPSARRQFYAHPVGLCDGMERCLVTLWAAVLAPRAPRHGARQRHIAMLAGGSVASPSPTALTW